MGKILRFRPRRPEKEPEEMFTSPLTGPSDPHRYERIQVITRVAEGMVLSGFGLAAVSLLAPGLRDVYFHFLASIPGVPEAYQGLATNQHLIQEAISQITTRALMATGLASYFELQNLLTTMGAKHRNYGDRVVENPRLSRLVNLGLFVGGLIGGIFPIEG